MPIRALTFDFWTTLFRDANSDARQEIRIAAFAEATGVSRETTANVLQIVWTEFNRCHLEEQRTLRPEDAVRLAAKALKIEIEPPVAARLAEGFATAVLAHPPVPIDGALEAVRAAAALGPVGLISDTGVSPGSSLRVLLDRHGFTEWFAVMTFSDEVGVSKPQAPMFETTARTLGVEPGAILHIGDREVTDIAGAKAFGAKAALFTDGNPEYANHTQADYVFHSWQEFTQSIPDLMAAE